MLYDWLVKLPYHSLPIIPCASLILKPSNSLTTEILIILGCQRKIFINFYVLQMTLPLQNAAYNGNFALLFKYLYFQTQIFSRLQCITLFGYTVNVNQQKLKLHQRFECNHFANNVTQLLLQKTVPHHGVHKNFFQGWNFLFIS